MMINWNSQETDGEWLLCLLPQEVPWYLLHLSLVCRQKTPWGKAFNSSYVMPSLLSEGRTWWVLSAAKTRPALVPVYAGSGACFQLPLFTSSFEDMFPQISGHLRKVGLRLLTHTLSAPKSHYMMTGQSLETLENGSHFPSTWASTQIIQSSVVKVRPTRRKTDSPKTRVPKTKSELPVTQKPP